MYKRILKVKDLGLDLYMSFFFKILQFIGAKLKSVNGFSLMMSIGHAFGEDFNQSFVGYSALNVIVLAREIDN